MPDRREYLDDIEEAVKLAIEDCLAFTWVALPSIVTSVNLTEQTIEAQPSIQAKVKNEDGTVSDVTLPLVTHCPIVWPRAGGYALTFPIAVGDEVLIIFADRCIDSWWQSGEVAQQIEIRMHDLSDGFAILAPTSQPKRLSNVSSTSVQLRNAAGSAIVEINNDNEIIINSPSNVVINGAENVNVTGENVSVSAENMIELSAAIINLDSEELSITTGALSIAADEIASDLGAACLVQEVVAGDYISVDNSDRERPVVTNTAPDI